MGTKYKVNCVIEAHKWFKRKGDVYMYKQNARMGKKRVCFCICG